MENRNNIIGGEFDIDLQSLQYQRGCNDLHNIYKYASGRSALYYILLDIKRRFGINKILLPDYLCSSVVFAASKAGMGVCYYELNESLEIDTNSFVHQYDIDSAVLIINYFGLQKTDSQVEYVRSLNPNAVVIEDDVQSYYEFCTTLNNVNYKFTSLRKTFAIPDGGLVKSLYELLEPEQSNKFHHYQLGGSILKTLRKPEYYDDEVYLSMFERGESMIDDEISLGMSLMAQSIISKTDIIRLQYIRKRNAKIITDGLNSLGVKTLLPVMENKTPLFVPIYVQDRNKVRKYMFQHNVFCPVHWPLEGLSLKKGAEMAEHELSLIVDQRYTHKDMEYILDLLSQTI